MKLINQLTLWYLIIISLVLLLGSIIVISTVHDEIFDEEVWRLQSLAGDIRNDIAEGQNIQNLNDKWTKIEEIEPAAPIIPFQINDTVALYSKTEGMEAVLIATVSYKIDEKHYLIRLFDFYVETHEIKEAVIKSLSWVFLLLLLVVVLTGRKLSEITLNPLKSALKAIQSFSLKQQATIQLPETRIREFSELNRFLEKMSCKAIKDYQLLKEFTENASHELQTPLTTALGKLELLMESEINHEQSQMILAAYNSIEKLARVNKSLILLSKLENEEFETKQAIKLTSALEKVLDVYAEMMEMKSIVLHKEIDQTVELSFNHSLIDILLSNLVSNAIRHNIPNGTINIKLTSQKLIIENTGNPPKVPTEKLFQRFKKSNQSADSVGLGLAIVKQICDLGNFSIDYNYNEQIHSIVVKF